MTSLIKKATILGLLWVVALGFMDTSTFTPLYAQETSVPTNTPALTCTNLVGNGSFENNSNWAFSHDATNSDYTRQYASAGVRSAFLSSSGLTLFDTVTIWQLINTPATTTDFSLSFDSLRSLSNPDELITWTLYDDENGLMLATGLIDDVQGLVWNHHSDIHISPSTSAGHRLKLEIDLHTDNNNNSVNTIYFDNVQLIACMPATPTATATDTAKNTPTVTSTSTTTNTPTATSTPLPPTATSLAPLPTVTLVQDFARSIASGDWDNDGDLDLVVASSHLSNGSQFFEYKVQIFRNDNIFLTPAWEAPLASDTRAIAWVDWDGDGDLDVSLVNFNQPNRIYENTGTTFAFDPGNGFGWQSDVSESSWKLDWGDWDKDGDLDLAVANYQGQSRLYRNDSGVLSSVWQSTQSMPTTAVAWGDWDNDEDLDLAIGNYGQPNLVYENDNGTLRLETQNGWGWQASVISNTTSLDWGDWDNDGDLDLAVSNDWQPNVVYENQNGGLWLDPSTGLGWAATVLQRTYDIAWGDYSGDGFLDLFVGNWGDFYVVYPNVSRAGIPWRYNSQSYTWNVAWSDFDGDSDLDLTAGSLVAVGDNIFPVDIRTANPIGSFLDADPLLNLGWFTKTLDVNTSVAWGDWDGDQDLDLAVSNLNAPAVVYENEQGALQLNPAQGFGWRSEENRGSSSVAWGDWDNDKDLDLAVGYYDNPLVYNNNQGQLNVAGQASGVYSTTTAAWGDWDGDGDLDLAVGSTRQPNRVYENLSEGMRLSLDPSQGHGWQANEVQTTQSLAWGDWDNDGDLDLAVGNFGQSNRIYENIGNTLQFDPQNQRGWQAATPQNTVSVAWGDWNGDGYLDLGIGNFGGMSQLYNGDGKTLNHSNAWDVTSTSAKQLAWGVMNGDSDLDLAFANYNNTNSFMETEVFSSTKLLKVVLQSNYSLLTTSLAWGDWDNDGDFDIATGNSGNNGDDNATQPGLASTIVFENPPRQNPLLVDNPPYVVIDYPAQTAAANFYASADVIRQSQIPIQFKLFDAEGDPARMIRAYYSPNGGGQWFAATPAAGVTTINLPASPTGTTHTFLWNAEADLIKNDNVVFRIEVYQGYRGAGPYQHAYQSAQTYPFRVEPATSFVKVVDEGGDSVANALVYLDGQPITQGDQPLRTNRAGLLRLPTAPAGQSLVALSLAQEEPTNRAGHNGWIHRTYLTSLTWSTDGIPQPATFSQAGQQTLIVRKSRPLVLFNLVASVEWDASADYLGQIERGLRNASTYLYDVSDGQMAFGEITVYDNGEQWADADLQLAAHSDVRPHAYIGGIHTPQRSLPIRVGRYWDGESGGQGSWEVPNGYRTLVHEFGHYALHLFDEYIGYNFSGSSLTGEYESFCTQHRDQYPVDDSASASLMYSQYKTSEIDAYNVTGLWDPQCEQTAQWIMSQRVSGQHESAWQTLARVYVDTNNPPRWQLDTPLARTPKQVWAGPNNIPQSLRSLPVVRVVNTGANNETVYHLVVQSSDDTPVVGALVSLYRDQPSGTRVINQGFSNAEGKIDILGAKSGDSLRASAIDGSSSGQLTLGNASTVVLKMNASQIHASGTNTGTPYLRVWAEPNGENTLLNVALYQFDAPANGQTPQLFVTTPGIGSLRTPTLSYSPVKQAYEGAISFTANQNGAGQLWVIGAAGGTPAQLQTTYQLQEAQNNMDQTLFSTDGNLQLTIITGSLPANQVNFVIMPPGAAPAPPPSGMTIVGDLYDVTASGSLIQLEKNFLLKLHYHNLNSGQDESQLKLYRWNAGEHRWETLTAMLNKDHRSLSTVATQLGIYTLMIATPTLSNQLFLPVITR